MPLSGSMRGGFAAGITNFLQDLVSGTDPGRRRRLTGVTWTLVFGIGALDYAIDTGDEISLHLFYLLPVALAVITRGRRFAVLIAAACVGVMLAGDIAAGVHYANFFIPCWNVLVTLGNYLILIWLLNTLLTLQREIEARVRQRTAALTAAVAERERLEREIVAIGQNERQAIGHDLHDGLCQHLTGTAIAARVLAEELTERGEAAAQKAWRIVALTEDAIGQTRQLARGLLLVTVEEGGLAAALRELAAASAEQFQVQCDCHCDGELAVTDTVVASHLFHIAQEAVRNAARHGKPGQITIALREDEGALTLAVSDDGNGIPAVGRPAAGMGLRIMAHRATMVGADFSVQAAPGSGTRVTCRLPRPT
jgi:signal transduction histidine kinase